MSIDRRTFVSLLAAATVLGRFGAARTAEERGLFWRVETRDRAVGVIFGYEGFAASIAPDVVQDGLRTVDRTQRVVLDISNFTLPPITAPNAKLPPVLPKLSTTDAEDLLEIATALGVPRPQIESMSGILCAVLLYVEGQAKPDPSIAGVIVERAKALGEPIAALLTQRDVEASRTAVDLVTMNATVDENKIAFLLDLNQFRERVTQEGVPAFQMLLDSHVLRPLLLARFSAALANSTSKQPTLFILSLGMLTGSDGILNRLRAQAAHVTVLA
jgi:hypothetical protein